MRARRRRSPPARRWREMIHPRYCVLHGAAPLPSALTPIYPTTARLAQARLRRLIESALARASLDDTLPEDVRRRLGLCDFREAVDTLHHPRPGADPAALSGRRRPAWRRSEEHTSELQSHVNLVCRLLLEKKKHYSNILLSHLYKSTLYIP